MTDTMDTTTVQQTERTAEAVAGLRALADHLEANPELTPFTVDYEFVTFAHDADDFAAKVTAVGGDRRKRYPDGYDMVQVIRDFGGGISLKLVGTRSEVCEAKVVGTETVEVPDPDYIANAPMVTETRPVIEWDCKPVLGGAA